MPPIVKTNGKGASLAVIKEGDVVICFISGPTGGAKLL